MRNVSCNPLPVELRGWIEFIQKDFILHFDGLKFQLIFIQLRFILHKIDNFTASSSEYSYTKSYGQPS